MKSSATLALFWMLSIFRSVLRFIKQYYDSSSRSTRANIAAKGHFKRQPVWDSANGKIDPNVAVLQFSSALCIVYTSLPAHANLWVILLKLTEQADMSERSLDGLESRVRMGSVIVSVSLVWRGRRWKQMPCVLARTVDYMQPVDVRFGTQRTCERHSNMVATPTARANRTGAFATLVRSGLAGAVISSGGFHNKLSFVYRGLVVLALAPLICDCMCRRPPSQSLDFGNLFTALPSTAPLMPWTPTPDLQRGSMQAIKHFCSTRLAGGRLSRRSRASAHTHTHTFASAQVEVAANRNSFRQGAIDAPGEDDDLARDRRGGISSGKHILRNEVVRGFGYMVSGSRTIAIWKQRWGCMGEVEQARYNNHVRVRRDVVKSMPWCGQGRMPLTRRCLLGLLVPLCRARPAARLVCRQS